MQTSEAGTSNKQKVDYKQFTMIIT